MKAVSLGYVMAMGFSMSLCFVSVGAPQTLEKIESSLDASHAPGMVPQPPHPRAHPNESCLLDPVGDMACYAGGMALFYGGIVSWERATGNIADTETGNPPYTARLIGEPMTPLIRLDGQWERPDEGLSVLDTRVEAGFGPIALEFQRSAFDEDGADSDLTQTRCHLLYRMSFSDHVEVDLGAGVVEVDGESTHNGFSFTSPLRYHPFQHIGFELWPSWSEVNGTRVDDYELSLLLNIGWASIKPGYRVWNFGSETLEGPAIGLSLHW